MAERSFCRHSPEVGAVCLNWACTDLSGGRGVTCVPTAIALGPRWRREVLMRWTAPHKASRCRRVIVDDESPERAVDDCNYHDRDRPCKEGVPNPRRRCREQACRCPEAQTQGGVGVLRQAGAVFGWHGGE